MLFRQLSLAAPVSCALLAAACSGDDGASTVDPPACDPATATGSLYGIATLVFDVDGTSNTYVALLPDLAARDTVTLDQAREFPGYAPTDAHEGYVVVGSGDAPTLTRYAACDDATWVEHETVSFGTYVTGLLDTSIYLGDDAALVPFDVTNWVAWNPSTFELGAPLGANPAIPLTYPGNAELVANRGAGFAITGDSLIQPYYYASADYTLWSQDSKVAILDTQTQQLAATLDVACPHLHIAGQDAEGNVYLSNGQGTIARAVLEGDIRNCFVKIAAGTRTVEADSLTYFEDLTDGREGSNVFPIGGGKALFNVYHAERDDLSGDPDPSVVDYSSNYHLWTLDLATHAAAPTEGIDYTGGQIVAYQIDGTTYLTVPAPDYSSTSVYEVTATGGVTKLFDVDAWAWKIFKVR